MHSRLMAVSLAVLPLLASTIPAQTNTALAFNGTNAYGTAPGVGGLYHNSTWEAWIRLPEYSPGFGYRAVLQRWGMYSHTAPLIDVSNGSAWGMEPCGAANSTPPAGVITVGIWHHVAVVYSTTAMTVFVDGAQTSTDPVGSCPYAGWETVLGANGYIGYASFFRGEIDEARISNVVRYTGPFTPQRRFSTDGNTVGLWHFDEGAGSTTADDSGNGRHFALHGGYAWVGGNTTIGATFTRFGQACASSNGPLSLQATPGSRPVIGRPFSIAVDNIAPESPAAIVELGLSRTAHAGLQLPLELGPWGMPGCYLLQSRDASSAALNVRGSAVWSIAIPNDALLAGGEVHLQAWCLAQQANAVGVVTSNGGTAALGW